MVERHAEWEKGDIQNRRKVDITEESLKKILGRMPNWKSPGPDLVQGFC